MSRGEAITWPPVAETAEAAGLDPALIALAGGADGPRGFVGALLRAERPAEAVRYLAHALPRREAVWWACRCIRLSPVAPAPDDDPDDPATRALVAAERWAAEPTEENRRAAESAGMAVPDSPAGCAALAAFWSGDNIAPPNLPAVAPAPDLATRVVIAAVMLSAVSVEPHKAPERTARFLETGFAVAEGVDRPTLDGAPAPPSPPEADRLAPEAEAGPAVEPPPAPTTPAAEPPSPAAEPPRPTPTRRPSPTRFLDTWE